VLGEEPLRTLDEATFAEVLSPKVDGALSLCAVTRDAPLDFFLLFGSFASVLGAAGQAHYAAGNAFLDALAHLLRREGVPATTLDWGPIARVGMAARSDIKDRLARWGFGYISPETMLAAIERAIEAGVTQAALVALDRAKGRGLAAGPSPFLSALSPPSQAPDDAGLRIALREASRPERRERLGAWLRDQIAGVMRARPDDVAVAAPFQELGIDSLMALELRNKVQRELGISLSATVLLSHNSVALLTEHLAGRFEKDTPAVEDGETLRVEQLPERAARLSTGLRLAWDGDPVVPARSALLTGATGFVGAFVLRELLSRSMDVACIARAPTSEEARARVIRALTRYGLWREEWASRLIVHRGDLAKPSLGLDEGGFEALAGRVDLVVHAGASVNWAVPYGSLEPTNVGGTREILRLCAAGRPKVLHYVSSLGTAAIYLTLGRAVPGVDAGARLPKPVQTNGYVQTKWVSEQLMLEARRAGLKVTIHRPGRITGDSTSGVDNLTAGQFFFSILKGCIEMGQAPALDAPLRLVPIDYIARAITELSLHPDGQGVDVNLTNPTPTLLGTLFGTLRGMGWRVAPRDYAEWRADALMLPAVAPNNALVPFAQVLRTLGEEEDEVPFVDGLDPLDDARTRDLLRAAGLGCPVVNEELIRTYAQWYLEAGLLPRPAAADQDEPRESAPGS
jgi:thioester reductase-like protein